MTPKPIETAPKDRVIHIGWNGSDELVAIEWDGHKFSRADGSHWDGDVPCFGADYWVDLTPITSKGMTNDPE